MKTVSVSEAESGIARLLRLVRKGETVVVMSRGKPVAEIRPAPAAPEPPADSPDPEWGERLLEMHRQGKIRLPQKRSDWSWLKESRDKLPSGMGVLDALLKEREEGR